MSSEPPIPIIRHQPAPAFQNAPRYLLDCLFRAALLVVLVAGLIVAIWHISWLHNQAGNRYEMHVSDQRFSVTILDRQDRVIYYSDLSGGSFVWKSLPLPK